MEAHKLQLKVFYEGEGPAPEAFIPVFHDWIKHHRLNELLVDVVSYAHVPRGPGVALIGHASDYYIDESEGRRGLLYSRKREAPAPKERLTDTFRRAFDAAARLEKEQAFAGKLHFRTDELLFRINDRLAAPNTEGTYATLRPELDGFCERLFGPGTYELTQLGRPKELFSVRIATKAKLGLGALLDRLGADAKAA